MSSSARRFGPEHSPHFARKSKTSAALASMARRFAGLYIGSKIARFDGLAYRVSEGAFLDCAAILAAQSIVARVDAEAMGRSTTPTTGPIQ